MWVANCSPQHLILKLSVIEFETKLTIKTNIWMVLYCKDLIRVPAHTTYPMTGAYEVAHYGHFFLWEMLSLVKTNPEATFQSFKYFPYCWQY
jgi:hypothetical protein